MYVSASMMYQNDRSIMGLSVCYLLICFVIRFTSLSVFQTLGYNVEW
jgi:hypothetical protein